MSPPTIYALASGAGRAGISVIRISGSIAGPTLRAFTGKELPPARRVVFGRLRDPSDGEVLDEGLTFWCPGPASFTGEDVVELHVHGGRAVVTAILKALGACEGLRLAEPGEFSRRAFENGKLDLTAVEGLADLVNAETEAQRRQALRQMQGELGRLYEVWRQRLIGAVANVEATIDFSDEDLPGDLQVRARIDVEELLAEITAHLHDGRRGERLRDGLYIVIVGPPNAGKSSLLNLLTRRNAAIVSDKPGTTRDVIETYLDIGGYPVVVADTAGICKGRDEVEREGIRRTRERAEEADLKLVVFDGGQGLDLNTAELVDDDALVVVNKIDLGSVEFPEHIKDRTPLYISVLTGEGIGAMLKVLETEIAERCQLTQYPSLTQVRHRQALEDCRDSLKRFFQVEAAELAAEDLRLAARSIGRITGRVGVEEMLDVIFRDFCIGK